MFSHKGSRLHQKDLVLFDIRLQNTFDTIVVKGNVNDASSVVLSGSVALSVLHKIGVNSLSLALIGTLSLKVYEKLEFNHNTRYEMFKKNFYEHQFGELDLEGSLNQQKELVDRLENIPELSGTNDSDADNGIKVLSTGNYEVPFQFVLPGDLIDTVEGLPNVRVRYHLVASLSKDNSEKSGSFKKFDLPISSGKKHEHDKDVITSRKILRIVRTLSSDTADLTETISVDNVWPEKVEYSISVPAKVIAIGSSANINIVIVPLLKNLKLGKIKVVLAEQSQYCSDTSAKFNQERTIEKLVIKDPLNHLSSNEEHEFQDKWEVDCSMHIPPTLMSCTQDCNILDYLRVRHKLRFIISLVNPDGHVSQLRASLPVTLFISPFIPLSVKDTHEVSKKTPEKLHKRHDHIYGSLTTNDSTSASRDNVIFSNSGSVADLTNLTNSDTLNGRVLNTTDDSHSRLSPFENGNRGNRAELMIPPNYENYIYDRVFSPAESNVSSPIVSRLQTPHNLSRPESTIFKSNRMSMRSMSDDASLDLSNINFTRTRNSSSNFYLTNFSDSNNDLASNVTDSNINIDALNSFSPVGNNNSNFNTSMEVLKSPQKEWKMKSLSRVPSYENAMKLNMIDKELPPSYPEKVGDNDSQLKKPQHAMAKSKTFTTLPIHIEHNVIPNFLKKSTGDYPSIKKSRSNTNIQFDHRNCSTSSTGANSGKVHVHSSLNPMRNQKNPDHSYHPNLSLDIKPEISHHAGSFSSVMGFLGIKDNE